MSKSDTTRWPWGAGRANALRWCALQICREKHPAEPCDEPCDKCWQGAEAQMREAQDVARTVRHALEGRK